MSTSIKNLSSFNASKQEHKTHRSKESSYPSKTALDTVDKFKIINLNQDILNVTKLSEKDFQKALAPKLSVRDHDSNPVLQKKSLTTA